MGQSVEYYDWIAEEEKWLNSLGYTKVELAIDNPDVSQVFNVMESRNSSIYYLLSGVSPRGFNHTVVCHGGGFAWDPAMEGGFLDGPMKNGFWELAFLVPLIAKEVV